ncbi:MAG: YceH family protein [Nitrospirae bacterium]|nr:YceH family protein [Nitrospirota bacterium]
MDPVLDDREIRILGCLIEKELTTPEYYPLSLNSLTNACNQKSNRNPMVSYEETIVQEALDRLQSKGLARKTLTAGSRVDKYLHTILDKFDLSKPEMVVLCELMLRGPQTAGELRSRAERMTPFENLDKMDETLRGLTEHAPALVIQLPREAGRKERRFMHLLSGSRSTAASDADQSDAPSALPLRSDERLSLLEEEIEKLRTELKELKQAFAEFRSQF